jgi:hypothetical protein
VGKAAAFIDGRESYMKEKNTEIILFETGDKSLTVLRTAGGERIALALNTEALQFDVTKG